MRRVVAVVVAAGFVPLACFTSNDDAGRKVPPLVRVRPRAPLRRPLSRPPDRYLTLVGGERILPRYKTRWERDLERMVAGAAGASPTGLHFDQYSDYRKNNYDRFFITQPPATQGVRAPAEFEPSQAYLLRWGDYSQAAWKAMFGQIVQGAWGIVPVVMIHQDAADRVRLEGELKALGLSAGDLADPTKIIWWEHQTNAIWSRDFGPVSLLSTPAGGPGKLSFVDFRYYHARIYDDEVPTGLAEDWGINVFRPDLSFEPGNFMNTSDGLCAMTKGTLWANPQLSQSAIEDLMADYLGCKTSIWPEPMAGVIPHIDMFSKFGSDTAVMVGEYTAGQDPKNKAILDANAQLFQSTPTPSGKSITVTRIPMPDKGGAAPNWIWRTYTNSVALNGGSGQEKVLLIPVYAQETTLEAQAMAAYAAVFPGWTQVKVTSDVIIPGEGATHCITMQIPVGDRAKMETDPADLCGPTKIRCNLSTCGSLTATGCCESPDTLKYCQGGAIFVESCKSNPQCGWESSKGWYECSTSGAADPSGNNARSCNVVTDASLPDMGPDASPAACESVGHAGCCDGETLRYCDNGTLVAIDCTSSPSCGWNAQESYYDCNTAGGDDPAAQLPKSCSAAPDGPMVDQPGAASDLTRDLGADGGRPAGSDGCSCGLGRAGAGPPPAPSLLVLFVALCIGLVRKRP